MSRIHEGIEDHLGLFQRHSVQDRWVQNGQDAMARRELEDVLSHGIWIFEKIRALDEAWSESVRAGEAWDKETAREFCEAYKAWLEPSDRLLDAIRRFEAVGHAVNHADRFRRCVEIAGSLPLDIERIVEVRDERESASSGIPLGDIRRELQRRIHEQGA